MIARYPIGFTSLGRRVLRERLSHGRLRHSFGNIKTLNTRKEKGLQKRDKNKENLS